MAIQVKVSEGKLRSSVVLFVGLVWLVIATALGVAGATDGLRPPGPQIILLGLTAALVLTFYFYAPFRRWACALDPRAVVALHLTRFVGAYFLVLYNQGKLPGAFAIPAGVGDLIVAVIAAGLLVSSRPNTSTGRHLYWFWNLLGLADIIGVVVSAANQWFSDPESMAAMGRLPLCLLLTFLVPLILASHVLLIALLWQRQVNRPGNP